MALKIEAEKVAARKKLLEVQRGALHAQMQERENLKREVRAGKIWRSWRGATIRRSTRMFPFRSYTTCLALVNWACFLPQRTLCRYW